MKSISFLPPRPPSLKAAFPCAPQNRPERCLCRAADPLPARAAPAPAQLRLPASGGAGVLLQECHYPRRCGQSDPRHSASAQAWAAGPPLCAVRAVPAICSGRAGCRGLRGSPAPRLARSTTSWSARQKRPSSRSANSSPGMSWRLQATQRKHSMWYTLARARITKSFLLKPMLHLAHLMPYNLSRAQPREKEKGGKEGEHE